MKPRPSTIAHLRAQLWWLPLLASILPTIISEWVDELHPKRKHTR